MNKKVIITLAILVLLVSSAVGFAFANGVVSAKKHVPSDYKIGTKYEEAIQATKPMVALFYVDWCGYCLKFMPKFNTLHSLYKDKFAFVMINAEDPAYQQLTKEVALTGFPTIYIIDPVYDNRVLLNNAIYMDMTKFRAELDRYLSIRKKLDSASSCKP